MIKMTNKSALMRLYFLRREIIKSQGGPEGEFTVLSFPWLTVTSSR